MLANPQLQQILEIAPELCAGVLLCLSIFVFCQILNRSDRRARIKSRQKKIRIKVAEIQEQRVQEQIRKPSFELRLRQFTQSEPGKQEHNSKMPYWQSDDLELKHTPPRPIEFIRTVLIRLKKLFILGAK